MRKYCIYFHMAALSAYEYAHYPEKRSRHLAEVCINTPAVLVAQWVIFLLKVW